MEGWAEESRDEVGEAGGKDVDCERQARQRGAEGDERGEGDSEEE